MTLEVAIRTRVGAFDLDVAFGAPGGITTLFGPSGAGKTLTLRCIAGLQQPREARIVLSGRTLADSATRIGLPARERRIGYVFQQYALFPHLDVAGNVAFGLGGGRAERLARVESLLELVELRGYGRRRVAALSGGEQQRVALARALAPGPDLVLLDEPFSALDGRVRRRLRGELRRVQAAAGVPMVLVTHSHAEMREISDSVVLLDAGRVLRAGPTADVLGDPGSAAAAELLAETD